VAAEAAARERHQLVLRHGEAAVRERERTTAAARAAREAGRREKLEKIGRWDAEREKLARLCREREEMQRMLAEAEAVSTAGHAEALRAELQGELYATLRKMAVGAGVAGGRLDRAEMGPEPKAAMVELLIELDAERLARQRCEPTSHRRACHRVPISTERAH
jgi:hypothetical protein